MMIENLSPKLVYLSFQQLLESASPVKLDAETQEAQDTGKAHEAIAGHLRHFTNHAFRDTYHQYARYHSDGYRVSGADKYHDFAQRFADKQHTHAQEAIGKMASHLEGAKQQLVYPHSHEDPEKRGKNTPVVGILHKAATDAHEHLSKIQPNDPSLSHKEMTDRVHQNIEHFHNAANALASHIHHHEKQAYDSFNSVAKHDVVDKEGKVTRLHTKLPAFDEVKYRFRHSGETPAAGPAQKTSPLQKGFNPAIKPQKPLR